jgi:uncharacterized membrane protein YgdD (TMEM256/DUF423 family)
MSPVFLNSGRELMDRRLVVAGAVLAGLAVTLGAFGAHAMKSRLGAEALGWWQTAVQYQMWHALAVLALGLAGFSWVRLPAWLLVTGAVIFAGTLYAMALGAPRWLGAITPLGGTAMIAGWAILTLRAARAEVTRSAKS